MPSDPVVLALEAAIAQQDSIALRNALGKHLLAQGGAESARAALRHFEAGLALAPADPEALSGAARAAAAAGDTGKTVAYELAANAAKAPAAEPRGDGQATRKDERQEPARLRLVADADSPIVEEEAPGITFAEVGGMDEVKQRLTRSFLSPLRNPDLFKKFGKRIGGGLVLYGPPGCGKTFLARAVAGEIGARFVNVGLNDVLDMWFGESERKLHELFENARRRQPTLVFFDEVDALGQRRTHLKGSGGRTLVNQLLSELDGFAGRNEGVFFLAATNHPWDLDPALRRPGRFDRLVFVPPPDAEGRRAILRLKLEGRPVSPGLDLVKLARQTDGFSGADIEALVGGATELAIEASLDSGSETPIDDALLQKAFRDLKSSTRPWFEVARNHAIYANEGGVYDDLLAHLKKLGLG